MPVSIKGFVQFSGTPPAIQWSVYSGPGAVSFSNPAQTNTAATFAVPGTYTLMLSADDGVHNVAYDACVISVAEPIVLTASRSGTNMMLTWTGGTPPFTLEKTGNAGAQWNALLSTNTRSVSLPMTGSPCSSECAVSNTSNWRPASASNELAG
jgi:hypothetical protein